MECFRRSKSASFVRIHTFRKIFPAINPLKKQRKSSGKGVRYGRPNQTPPRALPTNWRNRRAIAIIQNDRRSNI